MWFPLFILRIETTESKWLIYSLTWVGWKKKTQSRWTNESPSSLSWWGYKCKIITCVNGSCSELAPQSHTLCSTTLIANLWWATHCGVLQSSISSDDTCEWTRCNNSSKHSAASPKHPNGNRRPASGPLASARRNGSGHSAGSELVCNCWNNS